MTTKEKIRRKQAAKRHRVATPEIIHANDESNDLLEAANLDKISDQAAADHVINTEAAPDFGGEEDHIDPTEDMTLEEAANEASKEIERESFEVKVAEFSYKLIDFSTWIGTLIVAGWNTFHESVVNGWIKINNSIHNATAKLDAWANSKVSELNEWRNSRPQYITRAELMECMQQVAVKLAQEFKKAQPQRIDPSRLNALLCAIGDGHKIKAARFYMDLTGSDLATAKNAIAALT